MYPPLEMFQIKQESFVGAATAAAAAHNRLVTPTKACPTHKHSQHSHSFSRYRCMVHGCFAELSLEVELTVSWNSGESGIPNTMAGLCLSTILTIYKDAPLPIGRPSWHNTPKRTATRCMPNSRSVSISTLSNWQGLVLETCSCPPLENHIDWCAQLIGYIEVGFLQAETEIPNECASIHTYNRNEPKSSHAVYAQNHKRLEGHMDLFTSKMSTIEDANQGSSSNQTAMQN